MAHRRKAGRKRKNGPRSKSGDRPSEAYKSIARDFGTLELQIKRKLLVGENADPDLSATAAGILHAHGHLDREQYEVALRYAALRMAEFGTPWPRNGTGREITEEHAVRMKRALDAMRAKLSHAQLQAVNTIAHLPPPTAIGFQAWQPQWFQSMRLGIPLLPTDQFERNALLAGLNALLDRTPINAAAA